MKSLLQIVIIFIVICAVFSAFVPDLLSDEWKPRLPKCPPKFDFDIPCSQNKLCFHAGFRGGVPAYKQCLDEDMRVCYFVFYHVDRWHQFDPFNKTFTSDPLGCTSDAEIEKFQFVDCQHFEKGECMDSVSEENEDIEEVDLLNHPGIPLDEPVDLSDSHGAVRLCGGTQKPPTTDSQETNRLRKLCFQEVEACNNELNDGRPFYGGLPYYPIDDDASLDSCRRVLKECNEKLEQKILKDKEELEECYKIEKACNQKLTETGYKSKHRSPQYVDRGPHIYPTVLKYDTPLSTCRDRIKECERKIKYMQDYAKLQI